MRKQVDGMVDDLATVELFSTCTRQELRTITGLCTPVTVPEGFVLTAQGGPALECFVVLSGTATVTVDGRHIATVGTGETGRPDRAGMAGPRQRRPRLQQPWHR